MIIKATSVKSSGGVGRVATYIAKDKGRVENYKDLGIFHNLLTTELDDIIKEFLSNYEDFAKKRSNGNIALHTMLSVNPLDREKMSVEIMDRLVQFYLDTAYPNALAFGTHHISEAHWHSHLLISSNEVGSDKSTRLSKADLKEVHMQVLGYMKEQFPELTIGINEEKWGQHLHSEEEYYQKLRNPDEPLTKDLLAEHIKDLFRASETSAQFYQNLEQAGYKTYNYKDRVQGVYFGEEDHKMRFSRLGIDHEDIQELDKQDDLLRELEEFSQPPRNDLSIFDDDLPEPCEEIETKIDLNGEPIEPGDDIEHDLEPDDEFPYDPFDERSEEPPTLDFDW